MTRRATLLSSLFASLFLLLAFASTARAQDGLVINEFLADPGDYAGGEFVEIYNGTSGPVTLDGYTLSDASNTRYIFGVDGPSVTLEVGQAATITDDPVDIPGFNDDDFLSLNNGGDTITLTDDQNVVVDSYTYTSSEVITGVSQALIPNGNLTKNFQRQDENGAMENFTPGRNNGNGSTLPVEFSGAPLATVDGRDVTLRWTTRTEENNLGFYAQHRRVEANAASQDGWTTAPRRVDGAGNSSTKQDYDYTVKGLAPGRYEFRIQQVDTDGHRTASAKSRTVEVGRADGFALRAPSQNPFRSRTVLAYSSEGTRDVKAVLYNSLGQQVRTLRPAAGRIAVDAGSLASGLYFVRLRAGDRTDVQSITLIR